ncbi:DUF2892 domain-containing protein [Mangrovibacterium marinum]|uniref:Inner membrane protein YgaP-like transmembrane domain-containing protein n=1 Tax=Mangrovibacterium marinum TaxID=1639118 RepID=A0A2T5C5Q9_9BACT|nr:DUF2892 domain-containing protein [Mangrovibacterium marinum]PTN10235.1 Protein of unknown function (DUF2892) [Mangrovibacterium marinum]
MKRNIGRADRLLRVIIAAIIALLFLNGTIGRTWGLVLMVIAIVLVLTSLFRFCPLYRLGGIDSCRKKP